MSLFQEILSGISSFWGTQQLTEHKGFLLCEPHTKDP